jgi:hypothetical protein
MYSTLSQDLVAPFFQQSSQNLGIVRGVYRIATQRGTKRRLQPMRSGRVGENLVNTRPISCSQSVPHTKLSRGSARSCIDAHASLVVYS